jgi:hypothetical protein
MPLSGGADQQSVNSRAASRIAALVALVALSSSGACGDRTAVGADSRPDLPSDSARKEGAPADLLRPGDLPVRLDAPSGPCTRLEVVGQLKLACKGQYPNITDPFNLSGAVTHNGQGFGVTWVVKQSGGVQQGQLKFIRIDYKANVVTSKHATIASNAAGPQITFGPGGYGVYYNSGTSAALALGTEQGAFYSALSVGPATLFYAWTRDATGYARLSSADVAGEPLVFERLQPSGPAGKQVVDTGAAYLGQWLAPRPGGFAAAWADELVLLDSNGKPVGPPVKVLSKALASPAAFVVAGASGYGVVYARVSDHHLEGQLLDAAGKPKGAPRPIAQAYLDSAALFSRRIFLEWTGTHYLLTYPTKGASSPRLQVLDAAMNLVGSPVALPGCSQISHTTSTAFGAGRLAVATSGGGYSKSWCSTACVAVLECRSP